MHVPIHADLAPILAHLCLPLAQSVHVTRAWCLRTWQRSPASCWQMPICCTAKTQRARATRRGCCWRCALDCNSVRGWMFSGVCGQQFVLVYASLCRSRKLMVWWASGLVAVWMSVSGRTPGSRCFSNLSATWCTHSC